MVQGQQDGLLKGLPQSAQFIRGKFKVLFMMYCKRVFTRIVYSLFTYIYN